MTEATPHRPGLGIFLGVFTPTVLTILGVIMYLRLGWVVAEAGLLGAVLIVLLANAITLMTALSMSALATNMRVGVGGAYFLISRSFGLELGGAVGIPLYLSQVLSVTLYAFGLAESLRFLWPSMPDALVPVLAAVIVVAVGAVAARSIELALKLQLPIMAFIAASILSLLLGADWGTSHVDAFVTGGDTGFWGVFAVFFPAVTGILAGVSLSGDLEEPSRAIPIGALGAVAVGAVIYLILPFALASAAGPATLSDPLAWTKVAAVPFLVMPGLWGAILSSAFGSILGAPRTLQALAEDRLAPSALAAVDPESGEPKVGLYFSAAIALAACALGQLNAVASVVTMFFLTTYGALNLVTFLETVTGDPAFRPRIRAPWWVSLAGGIGCFGAMFLIDWKAGALAITVEAALFYGLSRRTFESTWGDVRGGLWMTLARFSLMNLRMARPDSRNWRPHILVFTRDLKESLPTVRMADAFGQHRGIVTVSTLIEGDVEDHERPEAMLARDDALLRREGIVAFCEVTSVPVIDQGVVTVAQANGLAGLQSNTAMFGFSDDDGVALMTRYLRLTRKLGRLGLCTVIYRPAKILPELTTRRVDIWWKGKENNGDLMLLLAHLVQRTRGWSDARLSLHTLVDTEDEARNQRRQMESMLPDLRIDVEIEVAVREPGEAVADAIRRISADASLVFLGIKVPPPGAELPFARGVVDMVKGLPPTVLVRNDGPFRGRLV